MLQKKTKKILALKAITLVYVLANYGNRICAFRNRPIWILTQAYIERLSITRSAAGEGKLALKPSMVPAKCAYAADVRSRVTVLRNRIGSVNARFFWRSQSRLQCAGGEVYYKQASSQQGSWPNLVCNEHLEQAFVLATRCTPLFIACPLKWQKSILSKTSAIYRRESKSPIGK